MHSIHKYWWSKNSVITLNNSIFVFNFWSRIFSDMEFSCKTENQKLFFRWLPAKSNNKNTKFSGHFGPLWSISGQSRIFLESPFLSLFCFSISKAVQNFEKKTMNKAWEKLVGDWRTAWIHRTFPAGDPKINLDFLRILDNPLSTYMIFKRVF